MLHRVPLVSIEQYSAEKVNWMLDEGCLGGGRAGFLGMFAWVPGEACLWSVLSRRSRGRLGRER